MMMAVARSSISTVIPRNPAACHRSAPFCIIQVAAVWLSVCGVTCLSSSAALTAAAKPLRTDRTALPFHSTTAFVAMPEALPAAQMRQQSIGQAGRRLPFLGLPGPLGAAMEHAALDVDVAATDRRLKSGAADRGMASAGVQTDEDEPRYMLADVALRRPGRA